MARRVPLPRLTNRQRVSRWQRERRQQTVVVTIFTAILLMALGLVAWAASERYYEEHLTPAVTIDGRDVAMREFERQLDFELVRFYQDYGVPQGFENDPNLLQQKASYEGIALDRVIEHKILDAEAKEAGYEPSRAEVDTQYAVDFAEIKARHILISFDETLTTPEQKEVDELNAAARARFVLNELRADPMSQELWNALAEEYSDDPGSQFSGGELGFAASSRYVDEFAEAIRTRPIGDLGDLVRTQFGWHIIQVQERQSPTDNELVQRYLTSGFSETDLREQARYGALKREFERRAKASATTSPTEQVHVAGILVNIPQASVESFQAFTEALQKQTDVRKALFEDGKDFAEVAKQYSDDTTTKDKGGEIGWVARGMFVDPTSEERVFTTEVGKVAEPVTVGNQWSVYKVLAKEASRELDADQKRQISERAYPYWLQRQRLEHGVDKHILEF